MYQPSIGDYPEYYHYYIQQIIGVDIIEGLLSGLEQISQGFENIPLDKHEFAYAAGKWTPKDMLLHITDTERVFSYRALRILRNDGFGLKGFDQDIFVEGGQANLIRMEHLLQDYKAVRQATISLFKDLSDNDLSKKGDIEGNSISAGSIGLILLGHELHHLKILNERYL